MRKITLFFLCVLMNLSSCIRTESYDKFDSSWKSLENYRCPGWFRDAKFGIFICWNPHSVAAYDDWYARNMYIQGHNTYKYHLEKFGHPSQFGYKDIIEMWKGENFDPDRLVEKFKEAGARYIVPMAVYHDNFDLWNSIYHEWNSVNHGPGKDIIALWKDATLKNGLRFGVTTHLARSWSWFQTSHGADTSGPFKGVHYDGANPEYSDLYFNTHGNKSLSYPIDPPEYWPEQWFIRIKDLIDQHQPDLLYFDGGIPFGVTGRELIAYFYNNNIKHHKGQLEAVMNIKNNTARPVGDNRFMGWHGDFREGVAVQDIERGRRSSIGQTPWQTDDSIGPWFWKNDCKYKSPGAIIHELIDIVSKNGNLLLNVPLKADGSLDEEAAHILHEIGKWISVNGEGIYGTRPFIHFNGKPSWNAGDNFTNPDNCEARDLRFTTKGDTIFVFTGDIPGREIEINALNSEIYTAFTCVEMAGINEKLQFVQDKDALRVKMPASFPCDYSICLKIY